jgi:hypothetical protein
MRVLVALMVLLSGCTLGRPNPNFDADFIADCRTAECIMDIINDRRFEDFNGAQQPKFMEGYPPADLRTMYDRGTLTMERMPVAIMPVAAVFGIAGMADTRLGEWGDMYSCRISYIHQGTLVHELQHCQGYKENKYSIVFFGAGQDKYTPGQIKVMTEEGKPWTETDFFRYQIPALHSYSEAEIEWHKRFLTGE